LLGTTLLSKEEISKYLGDIPKISKLALNCEFLLSVEFEKRLEEDLDSFKESLGLKI
jgi:ubiquinone biosynthesis protein Coq4